MVILLRGRTNDIKRPAANKGKDSVEEIPIHTTQSGAALQDTTTRIIAVRALHIISTHSK